MKAPTSELRSKKQMNHLQFARFNTWVGTQKDRLLKERPVLDELIAQARAALPDMADQVGLNVIRSAFEYHGIKYTPKDRESQVASADTRRRVKQLERQVAFLTEKLQAVIDLLPPESRIAYEPPVAYHSNGVA